MSEEEDFSLNTLQKSEKIIGQIYPVIVTKEGKVLEGKHRLEANPNWQQKVVEPKDAIEEILIRMHAHHRRRISKEETQASLLELARHLEVAGVSKENITLELAKIVPYSEGYIRKLLPIDYKKSDKAEAGAIGGAVLAEKYRESEESALIGGQKIQQPTTVKCSCCPLYTLYPQDWNGESVCPSCFDKLGRGEITPKEKPKPKEREIPESKPAVQKPKETWEFRQAQMKPQHSNFEASIITDLQAEGMPIERDREFCLERTIPDGYIASKNGAIYIDNTKIHQKREDRDERLRELLQERYGCNLLVIKYDADTEEQREHAKQQVRDWMKGGS